MGQNSDVPACHPCKGGHAMFCGTKLTTSLLEMKSLRILNNQEVEMAIKGVPSRLKEIVVLQCNLVISSFSPCSPSRI